MHHEATLSPATFQLDVDADYQLGDPKMTTQKFSGEILDVYILYRQRERERYIYIYI